MRLDYKKILLVGLSFFVIHMIWAVCNITIPIYLGELGFAGFLIGAVMAVDNLFAIVFQPIFGVLSDRTSTSYGKRMPYLLVGIPVSALCFFLISLFSGDQAMLVILIVVLGFSVSVFRTPAMGLLYDLTPGPMRLKSNRMVNLLGGAGAVLALLVGGLLYDNKKIYPFAVVAMIAILAIILLYSLVKEPGETLMVDEEGVISRQEKPKGQRLNLLFLLIGAFFLFAAMSVVETFFSTYAGKVLGAGIGTSFYMYMVFSIFMVIFAFPSEMLAHRVGRKNSVLYGLIALTAAFVLLIFMKSTTMLYILMAVAGAGWAVVSINSYVMVAELTLDRGIRRYTGFYYIISMLASIFGPILYGFLKDNVGDDFLFIYASVTAVFAFFFMMLVKHGETAVSDSTEFSVMTNEEVLSDEEAESI